LIAVAVVRSYSPPFRHQIGGASDEHVGRDRLHHVAHAMLVLGLEEGPQEADGDGADAFADQAADGGFSLRLVERHGRSCRNSPTRSETPATRRFGTIGSGFWLSGKCTTWRTSRPPMPREPRMMWMTSLCPARGDEADARARASAPRRWWPTVVPCDSSATCA